MADNKPSKELSEYDKYRIVCSNSKNVRLDFYHNRVKFYPELSLTLGSVTII